jgi:hypothetical protein
LHWDPANNNWTGSLEFRPGEPVEVVFTCRVGGHGSIERMLRFARRQLVLMRAGEAGYRGYRRRVAKELLKRQPGRKGVAVEARWSESLILERLAFDDDGASVLHYGNRRSSDLRAAVAINAQGRVTLIDTRRRSEIEAFRRALEAQLAREAKAAARRNQLVDRTFGQLTWEPGVDRYVGRFEFSPNLQVEVDIQLTGNADDDIRDVLRFARRQLRQFRRGLAEYQLCAALALQNAGGRKRQAGVGNDHGPGVRLTRLTFDEEGGSALCFMSASPPERQVVVEIGDHGKVLQVWVG